MSDAFLHADCYGCESTTQLGRHDAISNSCVNLKITRLPVKAAVTSCWYTAVSYRFAIATPFGFAIPLFAGQNRLQPPTEPCPNSSCLRVSAG